MRAVQLPGAETPAWGLARERDWHPFVWIGCLALALFTLRLAAPPNLLDQDQENPAAYVLDAVKNGHWAFQRDLLGQISSKPPLYTWLAALVTVACGRISLFSLYLPGAVGLLGTAWLVLGFGRKHFGASAGLFGALACMLCTAGLKWFGLARTDGVFAFLVASAAFLAYRAWIRGRGWTWFWLAAAGATLTKGPLGLLLAAFGLLACLWERRTAEPTPLRGSPLSGIVLFFLITAGWLALACWQLGWAVLDKLILQELVFHVVEGEQKKIPGSLLYLSGLYYLARGAPWSLLGYYGLWRIWRYPAADPVERRAERFLFCWFVSGLILFSLMPHQRGDLLWPIMPAGALIAGRELARLVRRVPSARVNPATVLVVLLAVAGFALYYFGPRARHPLVRQTLALKRLASEIERQGGWAFPLTHTDDPTGLQVYLDTYQPPAPFEQAAVLLRGSQPAYVAVTDWARLEALRQPGDPPVYTLLQADGPVRKLNVRIVSNRPEFLSPGQ